MRFALIVLSALSAVSALPTANAGEGSCCAHCSRHCGLKAVCRLVCEKKTVKETVYECKCEDFCVPGHSTKCGTECVCDCDSPCGKKCQTIWKPCCGEVRCRTLLTKKEVSKEVPSYKCVVEYVCDSCCASCCSGPHATHAPLSAVERGESPPLPPPAIDQRAPAPPSAPPPGVPARQTSQRHGSGDDKGFSFGSLFGPRK